MALRGAKPIPSAVKYVTGKPGRRRPGSNEPVPTGRPLPPTPLKGRPLALWRRFIGRAWWLTEFDAPKAWLWCHLHAEAETDPGAMTAARIGQLRSLGSELGLDPASRARLGGAAPGESGPEDKFFK